MILGYIRNIKNILVVLLNIRRIKLKIKRFFIILRIDLINFFRKKRKNRNILLGLKSLMILGCILNRILRRNSSTLKQKEGRNVGIKLIVFIVIRKKKKMMSIWCLGWTQSILRKKDSPETRPSQSTKDSEARIGCWTKLVIKDLETR